jgi:hypothetical protein
MNNTPISTEPTWTYEKQIALHIFALLAVEQMLSDEFLSTGSVNLIQVMMDDVADIIHTDLNRWGGDDRSLAELLDLAQIGSFHKRRHQEEQQRRLDALRSSRP